MRRTIAPIAQDTTATAVSQITPTTSQIERLARSRYWSEVRTAINNLYQRAFGPSAGHNGPVKGS